MDIKKVIEDVVATIKHDKTFATHFKKDPVDSIKNFVKTELPEEMINKIVKGVQSKLKIDEAGDLLGKAKNLFKK